jgi:hypothetical protein
MEKMNKELKEKVDKIHHEYQNFCVNSTGSYPVPWNELQLITRFSIVKLAELSLEIEKCQKEK